MAKYNMITVKICDENTTRKSEISRKMPLNFFQENDESFQVICGHDSNMPGHKQGTEDTSYAERNPDKLIVLYSGGESLPVSIKDLQSQRVLIVERTVDNKGIERDEWEQIYQLIDFENRTFTQNYLIRTYYIPAILILCQGYLLAYNNESNSDVVDALKKMGWNTDLCSRELIEKLKERRSTVNTQKWWLDSLNNGLIINEKIKAQIGIEWDQLYSSETTKRLLSNRSYLDVLIEEIVTNSPIQPTTVAKAYLDMVF
jgi:hypothetical protein